MLTTSTFLTIPQVILTIQFINMTWPEEFVLIFLKFQKLISSSKWDSVPITVTARLASCMNVAQSCLSSYHL